MNLIEKIAPYLSYKLNCKYGAQFEHYGILCGYDERYGIQIFGKDVPRINLYGHVKPELVKPIFKPLSMLTEEIIHNEQKFVPLLVLAAMASTSDIDSWEIKNGMAVHKTGAQFYLSNDHSWVYKNSNEWKDFGVASLQLNMFRKMYEWHFDINNMIRSNEAISWKDAY